MFDYTTIMIARKEHEGLSRKGTPEYSPRPIQNSLVRRARNRLGGVLILVGKRLKTHDELGIDPAPMKA
jgi:hypothetical protein